MTGNATCPCQRCGQLIEFAIDLHDTETSCPHCHRATTLSAVRPVAAAIAAPAPPAVQISAGVVAAGYVFAFVFPLVGLMLGIIVMVKGRVGSGAMIVLTSLIASALWGLIFLFYGMFLS